jgi:hypothetical protein
MYALLPSPICATCPAHLILELIILVMYGEDYKLWGSSCMPLPPSEVQYYSQTVCVLPLMQETKFHTYTQQEEILEFGKFKLCAFREQKGRQKILNRIVTSIPWIWSPLNFFMNAILICYYHFQAFELHLIFQVSSMRWFCHAFIWQDMNLPFFYPVFCIITWANLPGIMHIVVWLSDDRRVWIDYWIYWTL